MGILDFIKRQPQQGMPAELGLLLDEGPFIDEAIQLVDAEFNRGNYAALDDVPDEHYAIEIGRWIEAGGSELDQYTLFAALFNDYLEWDIYGDEHRDTACAFMESCVAPILSDYYTGRGFDFAELKKTGIGRWAHGEIYLVIHGNEWA